MTRAVATHRAAEEEKPRPSGSSEVTSTSPPEQGWPAAPTLIATAAT